MTKPDLPSAPAEAMADKILRTLIGSLEASGIVLGARLGCWRALDVAGVEGLTEEQLSQICGIHPRYAREWLEAMGAGGLLLVDPESNRFALHPGAREVLVDPDSELYLAPMLRQAVSGAAMLRPLEAAYRSGSGLDWADHDPDMADAQGDINQLSLRRHLPNWIREFLPSTATALEDGGAVADVGCGYGWASVGIAEAFPTVTVDAYDPHFPSAQHARRNVVDAGLDERIRVHDEPLTTAGTSRYDLVVMAEMLHDVPDPVGVLGAALGHLAPQGVVLVMDMKVDDHYAAPSSEVERMMYGWSLLICLPGSMTQRPSATTGTVFRPNTLRAYANEAGLRNQDELPVVHDFWRFWALTP